MAPSTSKSYYLAGPMSGIPQFNFPAFYGAAAHLRALGYDIVSPAELDDAETAATALASKDGHPETAKRTWGDFLSRDVKIVADRVAGIIFLPNWQQSRGAKLEAFTALLCKGHEFFTYDPATGAVSPVSTEWVRHQININL